MRRRSRPAAVLLLALVPTAARAEAAPGIYELAQIDGHRRCTVVLARRAKAEEIDALRMPATCRLALPALKGAIAWKSDGDALAFVDSGGTPVVTFAGGSAQSPWRSEAAEARFSLTWVKEEPQPPGRRRDLPPLYARPAPPPIAAAERPPQDEVGGVYRTERARVGQSCTLTLADAPGPKPGFKQASLASACPDHGLVVFDPAGWRYEDGRLVLLARRGHDQRFAFDRARQRWRKDPPSGAELFLTR